MKMFWLGVGAIALAEVITPACAAPPSDGLIAYGRGNYLPRAGSVFRSAKHGNAKAQTLLGFMYENGRGVPQNYVLAAEWYGRAAAQGDPGAQYLLGLMFDKGRGVPQDDILAHMWLILATARATERDRDNYARIRDAVASKMTRAQVAQAQWLAYEWAPRRQRW
jgi:TPR repeat protein